jgi:N-acetyl-anhydromuramyl-L-alanine amidase AmpD
MTVVQVNYPPPAFAMETRDLAVVTDFIIHHSAGALTQTPLDIDAEHRAEGWAMIGYHYVITPDGTTYQGRQLTDVPSAAYGRNTQSVDACLIGNFQSDDPGFTGPPTAAQVESIKNLSVYVHQHIPTIDRTIGHRDVAPLYYPDDQGEYSTACPGDEGEALLPEIKTFTEATLNR